MLESFKVKFAQSVKNLMTNLEVSEMESEQRNSKFIKAVLAAKTDLCLLPRNNCCFCKVLKLVLLSLHFNGNKLNPVLSKHRSVFANEINWFEDCDRT